MRKVIFKVASTRGSNPTTPNAQDRYPAHWQSRTLSLHPSAPNYCPHVLTNSSTRSHCTAPTHSKAGESQIPLICVDLARAGDFVDPWHSRRTRDADVAQQRALGAEPTCKSSRAAVHVPLRAVAGRDPSTPGDVLRGCRKEGQFGFSRGPRSSQFLERRTWVLAWAALRFLVPATATMPHAALAAALPNYSDAWFQTPPPPNHRVRMELFQMNWRPADDGCWVPRPPPLTGVGGMYRLLAPCWIPASSYADHAPTVAPCTLKPVLAAIPYLEPVPRNVPPSTLFQDCIAPVARDSVQEPFRRGSASVRNDLSRRALADLGADDGNHTPE